MDELVQTMLYKEIIIRVLSQLRRPKQFINGPKKKTRRRIISKIILDLNLMGDLDLLVSSQKKVATNLHI